MDSLLKEIKEIKEIKEKSCNEKEYNKFSFFIMPKVLLQEKYKKISGSAKLLYSLLLDRNNLSKKNNWIDEEGKVFVIFTRKEAMEKICCADQKIAKCFKELKDNNLIEEKVRGKNKANILYIKEAHSFYCENRDFENHSSGTSKITVQGLRKSKCNNTNIINTEGIKEKHMLECSSVSVSPSTLNIKNKDVTDISKTEKTTQVVEIKVEELTKEAPNNKAADKQVKNQKHVKGEVSDKYSEISEHFEEIWEHYKNKRGKSEAFRAYKKVFTKIDKEHFLRCIERYTEEKDDTELRYWKHGSTFFLGGYLDYTDENYVKQERYVKIKQYPEKEHHNNFQQRTYNNDFYKNVWKDAADIPCESLEEPKLVVNGGWVW